MQNHGCKKWHPLYFGSQLNLQRRSVVSSQNWHTIADGSHIHFKSHKRIYFHLSSTSPGIQLLQSSKFLLLRSLKSRSFHSWLHLHLAMQKAQECLRGPSAVGAKIGWDRSMERARVGMDGAVEAILGCKPSKFFAQFSRSAALRFLFVSCVYFWKYVSFAFIVLVFFKWMHMIIRKT